MARFVICDLCRLSRPDAGYRGISPCAAGQVPAGPADPGGTPGGDPHLGALLGGPLPLRPAAARAGDELVVALVSGFDAVEARTPPATGAPLLTGHSVSGSSAAWSSAAAGRVSVVFVPDKFADVEALPEPLRDAAPGRRASPSARRRASSACRCCGRCAPAAWSPSRATATSTEPGIPVDFFGATASFPRGPLPWWPGGRRRRSSRPSSSTPPSYRFATAIGEPDRGAPGAPAARSRAQPRRSGAALGGGPRGRGACRSHPVVHLLRLFAEHAASQHGPAAGGDAAASPPRDEARRPGRRAIAWAAAAASPPPRASGSLLSLGLPLDLARWCRAPPPGWKAPGKWRSASARAASSSPRRRGSRARATSGIEVAGEYHRPGRPAGPPARPRNLV